MSKCNEYDLSRIVFDGLLILLCAILIGMIFYHNIFVSPGITDSFTKESSQEFKYLKEMLDVNNKIQAYEWSKQPFDLTVEEMEIAIELKKNENLSELYNDLVIEGRVPSLNIIKGKMHNWFEPYHNDQSRFDFAWKEYQWISFHLEERGFDNDTINQWCKEYGKNMQNLFYRGLESKIIKDVTFRKDMVRFRFDCDSIKNFEIIVTDQKTKRKLMYSNQGQPGIGEFYLKNENNPYSIQVNTDDYWMLLCES
jgi:hypothetical protein